MEIAMTNFYGLIGIAGALALAAVGSALGVGTAGMAAMGAWKKAYLQDKPAPFALVVFVGAPLTQVIYGWLLMGDLINKVDSLDNWILLAVGVLGGLAIGLSAFFQGKAGAGACDALTETGKGFAQYITVLGLIETVALFVMVFFLILDPATLPV
jgi:V/A-type H+-transporting ATPase subunit K